MSRKLVCRARRIVQHSAPGLCSCAAQLSAPGLCSTAYLPHHPLPPPPSPGAGHGPGGAHARGRRRTPQGLAVQRPGGGGVWRGDERGARRWRGSGDGKDVSISGHQPPHECPGLSHQALRCRRWVAMHPCQARPQTCAACGCAPIPPSILPSSLPTALPARVHGLRGGPAAPQPQVGAALKRATVVPRPQRRLARSCASNRVVAAMERACPTKCGRHWLLRGQNPLLA